MRAAVALLVLSVALPSASACTCFFIHNQTVALFARNYDWNLEQGTLVVNKRGVAKTAFSFDNPATWTSKYGSVTFNQYGREFPNDGMNEAGLVVAVMWLHETLYPPADERPSVGSAQWVQYQLDTAGSVAEVIASDDRVRIWPVGGGLVHYLVADATGAAAVIEWIDGKRVVHTGDELAAAALANTTYKKSLLHLQSAAEPAKGERPKSSIERFTCAAHACRLSERAEEWTIENTFERLAAVSQPYRTKWSIVYDVANRSVQFKTASAPQLKRLDFGAVDFSTDTPVQVMDMATNEPGDVTPLLVDYNTEQNLADIDSAFDNTFFLKPWPRAFRRQVATYPDRQCKPVAVEAIAN